MGFPPGSVSETKPTYVVMREVQLLQIGKALEELLGRELVP